MCLRSVGERDSLVCVLRVKFTIEGEEECNHQDASCAISLDMIVDNVIIEIGESGGGEEEEEEEGRKEGAAYGW
jgi:hypothetical protein